MDEKMNSGAVSSSVNQLVFFAAENESYKFSNHVYLIIQHCWLFKEIICHSTLVI